MKKVLLNFYKVDKRVRLDAFEEEGEYFLWTEYGTDKKEVRQKMMNYLQEYYNPNPKDEKGELIGTETITLLNE